VDHFGSWHAHLARASRAGRPCHLQTALMEITF
jgi:hypothetical protein